MAWVLHDKALPASGVILSMFLPGLSRGSSQAFTAARLTRACVWVSRGERVILSVNAAMLGRGEGASTDTSMLPLGTDSALYAYQCPDCASIILFLIATPQYVRTGTVRLHCGGSRLQHRYAPVQKIVMCTAVPVVTSRSTIRHGKYAGCRYALQKHGGPPY